MTSLTIGTVLGAAVVDSWNPCAIGVLLLLVSLIMAAHENRRYVVIFGLTYVLGVYVTYFLIGLGILQAAHLFGIHGFFGYLAVALLLVFGIAHLRPDVAARIPGLAWLMSCKVPHHADATVKRNAALAGIVLGLFVGLCEFPCSGGIYLAVVALLAQSTSYWSGIGYLAIYNLIFVLPLVILLAFIGRPAVLDRIKRWQGRHVLLASRILGAGMILGGITLLAWMLP
jgi:cytochrome c biogenesis protein CcdA